MQGTNYIFPPSRLRTVYLFPFNATYVWARRYLFFATITFKLEEEEGSEKKSIVVVWEGFFMRAGWEGDFFDR